MKIFYHIIYWVKVFVFKMPNFFVLWDSLVSKWIFLYIHRKSSRKAERKISDILFQQQFVAHAQYNMKGMPNNSLPLFSNLLEKGYRILECDVMFTRDNVPILCHDFNLKAVAKYKNGEEANIDIKKATFAEISSLNFAVVEGEEVVVTRLQEILELAKSYNACVEIDMNKKYLGRKKCRIVYDIVKKNDMLQNVIFEIYPSDFYSFAMLDSCLVYQMDNTWSQAKIKKVLKLKNYSSLIILSQWFEFDGIEVNSDVIERGHQLGFLLKCATINSENDARLMFLNGVDLITTDELSNTIIK